MEHLPSKAAWAVRFRLWVCAGPALIGAGAGAFGPFLPEGGPMITPVDGGFDAISPAWYHPALGSHGRSGVRIAGCMGVAELQMTSVH